MFHLTTPSGFWVLTYIALTSFWGLPPHLLVDECIKPLMHWGEFVMYCEGNERHYCITERITHRSYKKCKFIQKCHMFWESACAERSMPIVLNLVYPYLSDRRILSGTKDVTPLFVLMLGIRYLNPEGKSSSTDQRGWWETEIIFLGVTKEHCHVCEIIVTPWTLTK